MSKWKEDYISEFADSFAGGTPSRSRKDYYHDGTIPWISSSEVNQPYIATTKEKITQLGFENSSVKWIPQKSVLVAMYGATAGQVSMNLIDATSNQAVLALVPKRDKIDGAFLYYQVKQNKDSILFLAQGSGQPNLSKDLIDNFKIKAPENVTEQRKISVIIRTVDLIIEKTQSAIIKYKAIKQGMLHDLFTLGIDLQTGKLRRKYEDAPELYKESKLGWIPKEWDDDELSKYLSFISYGFTNPMPETKEGPYLITAANVNGGKIQYETCRKTSKEAFDNFLTDKSKPKVDDILLTKDGTLGRIAIVEEENLCINQSVAVLRPNKLIHPLFLKILLESPSYQKTMIDEAGGSTIKHIYITVVDKMPIGVPKEIDEQKQIAHRLETLDKEIQIEQNYLLKLQQIKAGLMGDLLSGKKEVKITDKEEVLHG